MSKLIDETGNRYGQLLVLRLSDKRTKRQTAQWECLCDCGNIEIIPGIKLRNGTKTRCRKCSNAERAIQAGKTNTIDLTGQRFGYVTVLEYAGSSPNKQGALWKCKCDCGNEFITKAKILKSGKTMSCGCYHKKLAYELGKKSMIDLTNQRFGKLTVLKLSNKRNAHGDIIWTCQCDCGNIVEVQANNLRSGNTTSCGCNRESQGEQKIKELLKNNNINFETQKIFKTCYFPETNASAKFDFYINNQYLIEYDGEQHFIARENGGWNNPENLKKTQEHDKIKNQWCKDNNIPLIRIPYTHYKNLCLEDLLLETSKYIIN